MTTDGARQRKRGNPCECRLSTAVQDFQHLLDFADGPSVSKTSQMELEEAPRTRKTQSQEGREGGGVVWLEVCVERRGEEWRRM